MARQGSTRRWAWIAGIVGVIAAGALIFAGLAGFFDRDPIRYFAPSGPRRPVAALFFSGDTGLRFGMGPYVSSALARDGIAVTGFSSPAYFATHRTRAEVDTIVADAVRQALAQKDKGSPGSDRLVLIGQSYGADILQTGLGALPADLRPRIAAVILVVPGETVFFRADPTSLAYRGTPDAQGTGSVDTITWAPLTCIYGAAETDSLCPDVGVPGAKVVRMPGGHFLDNDRAGLVAHVVAAIRAAVPQAFAGPRTAS